MASIRKSQNQSRIPAINDARDAILARMLERADKDSERFMSGLLANPKLTFALKSFDQVIVILLAKGHKNELAQLSKHHLVGQEQKSQLCRALLNAGFAELCESDVDSTPTASVVQFSAARQAAEAAFAQLSA